MIFNNPRFSKISLSSLEGQNAIENNRNYKFTNIKVLRIITSSKSGANVYSHEMNNSNQITMKFTRLIISRVHSNQYLEYNTRLVYIMQSRNENLHLWNTNTNNCDNGAILIGYLIRFPCPLPIIQCMICNIPMIKLHHTVILTKNPVSIARFPMNNEIESNTYLGFVQDATQLTVSFSALIKTSCSVNLCD